MTEETPKTEDPKKDAYTKAREDKLAAKLQGDRKRTLKRLVYGIGALCVLAGIAFGLWQLFASFGPEREADASFTYPIIGRDHIPENSLRPSYNSNPPTSGPHYAEPAFLGLYDKELPDERVVHNLEHGEIWVSYHPRVKDQITTELKALLRARVIIAARAANDTDIAVAAWGRLDKFDLTGEPLDTVRILDFIKRYQNRGPEHLSSDTMVGQKSDRPIERP